MTRKESPTRFSVFTTSTTRSTLGVYVGILSGSSTKSNTFSIGASMVARLCICAIVTHTCRTQPECGQPTYHLMRRWSNGRWDCSRFNVPQGIDVPMYCWIHVEAD